MCGIAGIFMQDQNQPVDRRVLEAMTKSMFHRGPDGEGLFVSSGVGLGHRRLAVLDIAAGRQPMVHEERGRALVYNGEVYNYRELRTSIARSGIEFRTNCDTEVLLHLAEIHSAEWLDRLNGMFAFALWDEPSRSLLLARDRLGVKPLYYTILDDQMVFASEIRAILLHPKVRREMNVEKIPEYLAFRSVCGVETMFKGIYELEPGHSMVFTHGSLVPKMARFWEEGVGRAIGDYVDPTLSPTDQFSSLFRSAVEYRLISDVPVGTYNSGGVDSSLVTSVVRSLTNGELHTFSVGFEEKDYDESVYAQQVATRLGTHHHSVIISAKEYVASFEETVKCLEEPLNHPHTVQLRLLSQYAKQFVTVVLTGEGSDELFAGYPRYQVPLFAALLRFLPRSSASFLARWGSQLNARRLVKLMEHAGDPEGAMIENARHTPALDIRRLYPRPTQFAAREATLLRGRARFSSRLSQLLYLDQRCYLPALLNRLDKTSMAGSVECRVPFLDYRLVEWSQLLEDDQKLRLGGQGKRIVKREAERWLPKELVYRPKVGFGVPVSAWLRDSHGLGRYLEYLQAREFVCQGLFPSQVVDRLITEHRTGAADHGEILWGLINLEVWRRSFLGN